VDHRRLRFTMDRRHGRPRELTGARPSATPVPKGSGQGGDGVEKPFRASPEGERWRDGRATRRRDGGRGCLVGARSGAGEEERRAGEGLVRCRILWGSSGWAVIGAGDGRQGGEKGQLNGWSNGGSVSGMFKHL
jgi:hypothetical protein